MTKLRNTILSFFIAGLALLCAFSVQAQQIPQYSQYIFNGLLINPAYAGSKGLLNANVIYRTQWTGLEGAPSTATASVDGVNAADRLGWGAYLVQDRIGTESNTTLAGSAAIKLRTSEKGVFSLGLAGGISYFSYNQNKIKTTTPNDPTFTNSGQSVITPELKAGFYYHTQKFYAGLSGANLLQWNQRQLTQPRTHLFFTSGYVFTLTEYLKLKPSILLKDDFKAPTSTDFNAFLLLDERLWLGASYRRQLFVWQDKTETLDLVPIAAMSYMAEFYATEKLRIGYAYDATRSGLNNYGSHEISLGFYFIPKQNIPTTSPRYF